MKAKVTLGRILGPANVEIRLGHPINVIGKSLLGHIPPDSHLHNPFSQ